MNASQSAELACLSYYLIVFTPALTVSVDIDDVVCVVDAKSGKEIEILN